MREGLRRRSASAIFIASLVLTAACGRDPCPTESLDEAVLVQTPEDLDELAGVRSVQRLILATDDSVLELPVLTCLTEVQEDLGITRVSLRNLDLFESLKRVGGKLTLSNVDELQNVHGLSQLESVGGLAVIHAEQLVDFEGLENLTSIGDEGLLLQDLGSVAGLEPLAKVESVQGDFLIQGNPALRRVSDMSALSEVGGTIGFFSNPMLEPCDDVRLMENVQTNQEPMYQSDPEACAGP